jgi:hypothetical protein
VAGIVNFSGECLGRVAKTVLWHPAPDGRQLVDFLQPAENEQILRKLHEMARPRFQVNPLYRYETLK